MCHFFFNDTPTTEINPLPQPDSLPISHLSGRVVKGGAPVSPPQDFPAEGPCAEVGRARDGWRSEEHTSELQSHLNLVCRLLLEKKISLDLSYITLNDTPTDCGKCRSIC